MGKNKKWRRKDDDMLKEYCGKIPYREIAIKFGVSADSIKSRMHKLGLKSHYGDWTKSEINYLKQNNGILTRLEISKNLNKTYDAVRSKAFELNLNSNLSQSQETRKKINDANTSELIKSAYSASKELAYIVGVIAGDGSISGNSISLATESYGFAMKFKKVLERWSGLNVRFYKYEDSYYRQGYYYLTKLGSKQAYNFLYQYYISKSQKKAIENLRNLLGKNKELKIAFIQGFFDSEGCIEKNGRTSLTNSNIFVINFIAELLEDLGINVKLYSHKEQENKVRNRKFISQKSYKLYIQYEEGIMKFIKIFNCSIQRKNDRLREYSLKHNNYSFYFDLVKDNKEFNDFIKKYHKDNPTTKIYGKRINWMIRDKKTKDVIGAIGISNSFLYQGTRDRWIGWTKEQRLENLHKVANNWRFCLIPNLPKNIASQILAYFSIESKIQWKLKYGQDLVLIETYIGDKHKGSSYLGAGWKYIGDTKGWKIKNIDGIRKVISRHGEIKKIFIKPLINNFQKELLSPNH